MSVKFIAGIQAVAAEIIKHKELLTSLDAEIGDADHGINMARGFEAVSSKISSMQECDCSTVLKTIGLTLLSTVGGASGPLYGTAFMRAANFGKNENDCSKETVGFMLEAAIKGIKDRGKAVRGEKTMLDALEPAYEAFMQSLNEGDTLADCFKSASAAAKQGVEYTKTIVATKGRASYLGERSLGHQDPGATSVYIILKTLADFCAAE